VNEAKDMVSLCEKAGINIFVNYMRNSDPGAIEIRRRIKDGLISSPIKAVVWYSKGLIHNGSHFFSLLEFWLGSFIDCKIINPGRLWEGVDPEPDFQANFELGQAIFISAWEESYSHFAIDLLSPSGRLRYEQGGELIEWYPCSTPKNSHFSILSKNPEVIMNDMHRYQAQVVDQIYNFLHNKPYVLTSGIDALASLEAINKIIQEG
jgi:predicted dehydrogenase